METVQRRSILQQPQLPEISVETSVPTDVAEIRQILAGYVDQLNDMVSEIGNLETQEQQLVVEIRQLSKDIITLENEVNNTDVKQNITRIQTVLSELSGAMGVVRIITADILAEIQARKDGIGYYPSKMEGDVYVEFQPNSKPHWVELCERVGGKKLYPDHEHDTDNGTACLEKMITCEKSFWQEYQSMSSELDRLYKLAQTNDKDLSVKHKEEREKRAQYDDISQRLNKLRDAYLELQIEADTNTRRMLARAAMQPASVQATRQIEAGAMRQIGSSSARQAPDRTEYPAVTPTTERPKNVISMENRRRGNKTIATRRKQHGEMA